MCFTRCFTAVDKWQCLYCVICFMRCFTRCFGWCIGRCFTLRRVLVLIEFADLIHPYVRTVRNDPLQHRVTACRKLNHEPLHLCLIPTPASRQPSEARSKFPAL